MHIDSENFWRLDRKIFFKTPAENTYWKAVELLYWVMSLIHRHFALNTLLLPQWSFSSVNLAGLFPSLARIYTSPLLSKGDSTPLVVEKQSHSRSDNCLHLEVHWRSPPAKFSHTTYGSIILSACIFLTHHVYSLLDILYMVLPQAENFCLSFKFQCRYHPWWKSSLSLPVWMRCSAFFPHNVSIS